MAKSGRNLHRDRRGKETAGHAPSALAATVTAMRWRLEEAVGRIREADDALGRGQHERVHRRLLDLEPLVHEAERVLAAALILVGEEARSLLVEPTAER